MLNRSATRLIPFLYAGILLIAGCTGYNRRESTELFPADSLSRHIAKQTDIDTLKVLWTTGGQRNNPHGLNYIGSLRFGQDRQLHVADVAESMVFVFDTLGSLVERFDHPSLQFPYLLDISGDTLAVHNAGSSTVDLYARDAYVLTRAIPASNSRDALSVIPGYQAPWIFVKDLSTQEPSLHQLDAETGREIARLALPGPTWRHKGVLRPWGTKLVSPSAYLPVVYVFDTDLSIDSLRLTGFDSPALNRTRSFVLGERDEPPLMIPSVAAFENRLFVINLRPGWIRVDVYDDNGNLQNILVEPSPEAGSMNAVDIDVLKTGVGQYHIAVASMSTAYGAVSLSYVPKLTVFRWERDLTDE